MQEAVPVGTGAMAAIIGMEDGDVEKVCAEITGGGDLVSPANYNSPDQTVISGTTDGVRKAMDLVQERGAKRAIVLDVSAPFHCGLMKPAMERLAVELESITFNDIKTPVISNVEAEINTSKEKAKKLLISQVCSPVRWAQSMTRMLKEGIEAAIEVGPGRVLCGLMRRSVGKVKMLNVENVKSLGRVQKY